MSPYQQTKYDIWATNLLFLFFALSVVMNYVTKKGFFASGMTMGKHFGLYLGNALMLGLYYYIRKGLKGAKISFLIIYGLVLFNIVNEGWVVKACDTPLNTFDFVSQHVLQLAASVLLIISLTKTRTAKISG